MYRNCQNFVSLDRYSSNAKIKDGGETPIYWAAWKGNTEIVKILAPLTDNPNAPNTAGETPIHNAACNGHAEIIKILAPLTVNPNAPDNIGRTPIKIAKNEDIRRIIESFNVSTKSQC